ncbi:hypothetical protein Tco_1234525 [Tanacetum coccineum]
MECVSVSKNPLAKFVTKDGVWLIDVSNHRWQRDAKNRVIDWVFSLLVAKAVTLGNRSVEQWWAQDDGTCNAGAESVGVSSVIEGIYGSGLMKRSSEDSMYVGRARWVWLDFDSLDQVERSRLQALLRDIFGVQDVSHDFTPDERRCLDRHLWVCHWLQWAPEVYKKLGGRVGKLRIRICRVVREEDVRLHGKDLEDDAGEILGVHSQGDLW